MSKKLKLSIWGLTVILSLLAIRWLYNRYSLAELQVIIESHMIILMAAYATLISLRGVLFVPTMPFIILMASTLPLLPMFIVTLSASCISAFVVCAAVDQFEFAQKIRSMPSKSVRRATKGVQKLGLYAIIGWAFFPFVFTDIIVYLARSAGMKRKTIISAVAIGEGGLIYLLIITTAYFQSIFLQNS